MVRLVDYDHSYALERPGWPRTHTQGLNHGDDEIFFNVERVLLDPTYGCTWTKLADALDPLVREETLVDDDHSPSLESRRERQGTDSLAHPHIE